MKQPKTNKTTVVSLRPRQLTVLCVDPGFRNMGWGVVCVSTESGPYIRAMGVIRTKPSPKKLKTLKSADNARTIRELAAGLYGYLVQYDVDMIAYEAFSMPQRASKSSATKIGMPYGILGALSVCHDIPTEQFTPQQVKNTLCGKANASKDDVELEVKLRFAGTPSDYGISAFLKAVPAGSRNHAWDALACFAVLEASDVYRALRRGYSRA